MNERLRRILQVVLVVVAVGAAGAAAYRYRATRGPEAAPTPKGKSVVATPSSGPVGTRPFLQLYGWRKGEQVKVLFCSATGGPADCADLGTGKANESFQARPIPATITKNGAPAAVTAGTNYVLRAGTAGEDPAPVRGSFRIVRFTINAPPKPRSYRTTDLADLDLGPLREVARGAPCGSSFTPDDRLSIGGAVFDPRTAVNIDLRIPAAELAWSPQGDKLAIVTDDRKEVRVASPDGSQAEVVAREARGLINSITWSHDGANLAFVARPDTGVRGGPAGPTVFRLDLTDGVRTAIGGGEAVAWSPSGERLAVEVVEGTNRAIQLSDLGGKRTRLTDGRRPAWSPDGSLLAFWRGSGDAGDAWVAKPDAGPGAVRKLGPGDVCGVSFSSDGGRVAFVRRTEGTTVLSLSAITVRGPSASPRR